MFTPQALISRLAVPPEADILQQLMDVRLSGALTDASRHHSRMQEIGISLPSMQLELARLTFALCNRGSGLKVRVMNIVSDVDLRQRVNLWPLMHLRDLRIVGQFLTGSDPHPTNVLESIGER